MPQNLDRLARCPACGGNLGPSPPPPSSNGEWWPPSMQLEVNEGERGTLDWRLSVFSRRHGPWSSADFRPARVRWVYWMCGDGHIFLDHLRLHGGPDPKWTVDDFNIIAAVGGVAAGKSYLLLRTLHQHLGLSGIEHVTRTRDIVPVEDRDS